MANNEEMLTREDIFEETSNSYQLDATEYDEDDEGTVEYLDLDLEVDSIPESTEEYISEVRVLNTKPRVGQSSVLKTSYLDAVELKDKRNQEPILAKHGKNTPMPSILRNRSSTEIVNANSTNQAEKRKIDSLASTTVHAAVNAINAKLADSAQSMNVPERNIALNERMETQPAIYVASNEDLETSQTTKTDIKSEGDSLDLFFQSMAQTVLHLPSQVQAKIKMDICKVIAMAEIKYCSSDNAANEF